MKTVLYIVVTAILTVLTTGCSTFAVTRYSINADNVVALRTLNGKTINIGSFSATNQGEKDIMCRLVGPIKTPDGEPFPEYVRKALMDEMKIANVYSANALVSLTGNLDTVELSSFSGSWKLALTIKSSNGKSLSVSEDYQFTSSYLAETACDQAAQALMPAVQDLVGKVVKSAEFPMLVTQ